MSLLKVICLKITLDKALLDNLKLTLISRDCEYLIQTLSIRYLLTNNNVRRRIVKED